MNIFVCRNFLDGGLFWQKVVVYLVYLARKSPNEIINLVSWPRNRTHKTYMH